MINSRTLFILLAGAASVAPSVLQAGRNDFGETLAATAIGSGIGSTIGTALGNAISSPRTCRRPIREEVIVREVRVPSNITTTRYVRHLSKLERTESKVRAELDSLLSQKKSLERRLKAIEQELSDIDDSIDIHRQSLKNIEIKKNEISPCESPRGREIAEIEVL